MLRDILSEVQHPCCTLEEEEHEDGDDGRLAGLLGMANANKGVLVITSVIHHSGKQRVYCLCVLGGQYTKLYLHQYI